MLLEHGAAPSYYDELGNCTLHYVAYAPEEFVPTNGPFNGPVRHISKKKFREFLPQFEYFKAEFQEVLEF